MNILRKLFLFIFSLLLLVILPIHTFIWTTRQTILDRNVVSSWLYEGRVYENVVDTVAQIAGENLNISATNQESENEGKTPDITILAKAVKSALPPSTIQENTESFIIAMYDWLDGKTGSIELNINLSEEKQSFINALGDEATLRAASLPTCNDQPVSEFDPLTSSCTPIGINIAEETEKLKNKLSTDANFLPNTLITADDITVSQGDSRVLVSEQFSFIPTIFKNVRNLTIYASLAVLLIVFLMFLLGNKNRSGLRIAAWIFGLAGLWNLAVGLLFKFGNTSISGRISGGSELSAQTVAVSTFLSEIASSIFYWQAIIGGAYIVIAFICYLGSRSKKNKKTEPQKSPTVHKELPSKLEESAQETKISTPQKTIAPNKPKKTTLVQ